MRFRRLPLTVAISLAFAPAAMAQEPGVTYDDDSPAGKEYAIPLDDAREVGRDDSVAAPSGGGTTPAEPQLFGEGVTPAASAGSGGGTANGGGNGPADAGPGGSPSGGAVTGSAEASEPVSAISGRAGTEQLQLGAILAAVAVLLAVGIGLVSRRARPRPTTT